MYTSMDHSPSFWAGFSDCTEEAIQFLLESENISQSDPIILGLREHLRHKQAELGLCEDSNKNSNQITVVSSSNSGSLYQADTSVSESMEMDMSLDRTDEGYNSSINITNSDISSDISFSTEEIFSTTHQQDLNMVSSPMCNITNTSFFGMQQQTPHTAIIPTTPVQAHTVTVDSFSPIMHTQIMSPMQQHQIMPQYQQQCFSTPVSNSQQQHQPQQQQSSIDSIISDPFQDPVSLALLAQNNPEIASVAQELFQLLSEECADSLLCDEDDIDDDDEDDELVDEFEVEIIDDNNDNNGNVETEVDSTEETTHDLNSYSESLECISIPISSEQIVITSEPSQDIITPVDIDVVSVGQSSDDKENYHPQTTENSNRMSPKFDNSLNEQTNVQTSVLRLSPQNH